MNNLPKWIDNVMNVRILLKLEKEVVYGIILD